MKKELPRSSAIVVVQTMSLLRDSIPTLAFRTNFLREIASLLLSTLVCLVAAGPKPLDAQELFVEHLTGFTQSASSGYTYNYATLRQGWIRPDGSFNQYSYVPNSNMVNWNIYMSTSDRNQAQRRLAAFKAVEGSYFIKTVYSSSLPMANWNTAYSPYFDYTLTAQDSETSGFYGNYKIWKITVKGPPPPTVAEVVAALSALAKKFYEEGPQAALLQHFENNFWNLISEEQKVEVLNNPTINSLPPALKNSIDLGRPGFNGDPFSGPIGKPDSRSPADIAFRLEPSTAVALDQMGNIGRAVISQSMGTVAPTALATVYTGGSVYLSYSPPGLRDAANAILIAGNQGADRIKKIVLRPGGSGWIVLYGRNQFEAYDIPSQLRDQLNHVKSRGGEIRDIVFDPSDQGGNKFFVHDETPTGYHSGLPTSLVDYLAYLQILFEDGIRIEISSLYIDNHRNWLLFYRENDQLWSEGPLGDSLDFPGNAFSENFDHQHHEFVRLIGDGRGGMLIYSIRTPATAAAGGGGALKIALLRKIKKLQKSIRAAKHKGQKQKASRLTKKLKRVNQSYAS